MLRISVGSDASTAAKVTTKVMAWRSTRSTNRSPITPKFHHGVLSSTTCPPRYAL